MSSLTPIRAGLIIYRIHWHPQGHLSCTHLHTCNWFTLCMIVIHHYVCLCLFRLVMYNELRCLNEAFSASHLHTSKPSIPLGMSLFIGDSTLTDVQIGYQFKPHQLYFLIFMDPKFMIQAIHLYRAKKRCLISYLKFSWIWRNLWRA